jgi:hypothetical protein
MLKCQVTDAKAIFFFALIIMLGFPSVAITQQVNWGFNLGSPQSDYVEQTYVEPGGNVFVVGEFRGVNVDFDPGAGTSLMSSNGNCDGFLAEYSSTGQFIRSFSIGGANLDKINGVATDIAGNIYITGYFRGANVDFDPSPATAFLTSNGEAGTDNGFGGDAFVAKYSPTGQYIWAFNVGGSTLRDDGIQLKVDQSGNVYVSGQFQGIVDFDPGISTSNLDSGGGTAFLAKYTSSGSFLWAINMGAANVDNIIYEIRFDSSGNVIVCGFFQGSNVDFDPSPASAILNANGSFDGFVAKYSTSGAYIFAFQIGGAGTDVARDLVLDNSDNIYVVGDFFGTVDFNPSVSVNNLTSNGSSDMFLAKYNSSGQYVWAFNAGSAGPELGWRITTDNSSVFVTGSLFGTADFDPGAGVNNLTTHGGGDIFLAKYNFSGNYLAAFNVGSPFDDYGFGIMVGGLNTIYLSGQFQGSAVDFDPTTSSTFPLSSNGAEDGFLVKYFWPQSILPLNLLDFKVAKLGSDALLDWSTAGESGFDHFDIERSLNGIQFSKTGYQLSHALNSNSATYQFVDPLPIQSGIIYYRLKMVNTDGSFNYSKVVSLRLKTGTIDSILIYPNPLSDRLLVNISSDVMTTASVRIFNTQGQIVISHLVSLTPGTNTIEISGELDKLQKGTYLLNIKKQNEIYTKQLIKL